MLVIIQRGRVVLEPSLASQAIILPSDLSPSYVASRCAAMIMAIRSSRFSAGTLTFNGNRVSVEQIRSSLISNIDGEYDKYYITINNLMDLSEYEHARELYWKTLHYSGFRELWHHRLSLSGRIRALAIDAGDMATASAVSSLGISYAYIAQRKFMLATRALEAALLLANEAHDTRAKATVLSYHGQIAEETGKLNDAVMLYSEAGPLLGGIDEYQLYLRRQLINVVHAESDAKSQIRKMLDLQHDFSAIADYRRALVDMEIAKVAWRSGAKREARFHAGMALDQFQESIIMPRNARKARLLLNSFGNPEDMGTPHDT